jgi:hypothetical protein
LKQSIPISTGPKLQKKLTIGGNREILLENNYDPIPIDPFEEDLDILSTKYLLLPSRIPNFESLSLWTLFFLYDDNYDDMLDFLKANSHITMLSFHLETIPQLFDIISSFQNLEHLNIFSNYSKGPEIIDSIKSSIPSNLKSASLNLNSYVDVVDILNKSFLQITNLTVKFKLVEFHQLCLFTLKLPNMNLLKSLKLIFKLGSFEIENIGFCILETFRSNVIKFNILFNLQYLEFKVFSNCSNTVKMDLNKLKLDVDGCSKLKCIVFKSEDNPNFFGDIGSKKLELDKNWKLITNPRRYLLLRRLID